MNQKQFGSKVKTLRTKKKMTLQQISTPKINRGQISKIERGVQDPKLSTMNKIGDVLGFEIGIVIK